MTDQAKGVRICSVCEEVHDRADQQPVPDEAKLTERETVAAAQNLSLEDDSWSGVVTDYYLTRVADAAIVKAWHARDAEVAELKQKAVDLEDCLDAYIDNDKVEDTLFANLHKQVAELQGRLKQQGPNLSDELTTYRLQVLAAAREIEELERQRDSAREQVRALVEVIASCTCPECQKFVALASAKEAQDD